MWTSAILAGKRDSRRDSTTGFSENAVVTEIIKLSNDLSLITLGSDEGLTSFNKNSRVNFSGEKSEMKLGVSIFFETTQNTFKWNLFYVVVLVLESKGLQ